MNSATWPDDFTESCNDNLYGNGNDNSSSFGADRKDLAVYAGHGNSNLLQWGFKHSNRCTVNFITSCGNPATCNIQRLGSMNGNDAGNAIYGTSCTLKQNRLTQGANRQWLWQQFGYHNSPAIGDNQLAFFYYLVRYYTWPFYIDNNKDAWLTAMEDKPGSSSDNSPIVVSYGQSNSEALDVRDNANLHNTVYANVDRPGGPSCGQAPPGFYWYWVMIDNGTSSVCN